MNRAALPRLVAVAALCVAGPALTVGGLPANAETPDPRPNVHRSPKGVLSYDDPRYDGRRTIAVKGRVETVIKDSFRGHRSETSQAINTDTGDIVPVSTRGGTTLPNGGSFVGKVVDTESESETQPIASATVTPETVAAAPAPMVHRAYVAVVTKPGDPTMTESEANTYVDRITDYWVDQSRTAAGSSIITSFPTQDTEVFESTNATGCLNNHNALWDEADNRFPGVTFSSSAPNHLIVVLPGCGGGGVGTVGTSLESGGKSALAIKNDGADQIGAHELGHNVGLGHANIEYCDAGGNNCVTEEYGNAYSVMADILAVPNSPNPSAVDTVFRQALGLTSSAELRSVTLPLGAYQEVETSVHLAPRESVTGTRAVEVTDPVTGQKLLVEYRSGTGIDSNVVYTRPNYSEGLDDGSNARFRPGVVVSRVTDVGVNTGPVNLLMTKRIAANSVRTSFGAGESYVSANGNITVGVTTANGAGGADIKVTLDGPFVASATPTINGTVKVGSVMTADPGAWDPDAIKSYQWLENGSPVTGATGQTYKPTVYGRTLAVRVTGTKPGHLTAIRTSAGIAVARGTFATVQPTISGTARVGRTLRANHGTWRPSPSSWSYQWRANGRAITGATRSYYVISKARIGQRITVQVTGRRSGYVTRIRTSSSTAIVTR